jgi:hypothetical protein
VKVASNLSPAKERQKINKVIKARLVELKKKVNLNKACFIKVSFISTSVYQSCYFFQSNLYKVSLSELVLYTEVFAKVIIPFSCECEHLFRRSVEWGISSCVLSIQFAEEHKSKMNQKWTSNPSTPIDVVRRF